MTRQEALCAAQANIVVRLSGEFALIHYALHEEYGFRPYWNGSDLHSLLGIIDHEWFSIEEWYWDETKQEWRLVQQI